MNIKFEHETKAPKYRKMVLEVILWLAAVAIPIVLANVFVNQGLVRMKMVGESMSPTLKNEDSLIVNKWFYRFGKPKRFDVVAYTQNGEEHSYLTVKRIIGLPGETVQIFKGVIYINGEELKEDIQVETVVSGGLANEPVALEDNEYFVLGDNRNNSEDSRFANLGNIVRDDVIGRVWIRTNSFSFVHGLNHKDKEAATEAAPTDEGEGG